MRWENTQGREADIGDHRFHVTVAEATGNGALVAVCNMLWTAQMESRIWREIYSHMDIKTFWPMWIGDHERIYEAIRAGNPKAASSAMSRHLDHVHEVLMAQSAFNRRGNPASTPAKATRKKTPSKA
jgi:GntR family uxuAB operon transcriptional repressor